MIWRLKIHVLCLTFGLGVLLVIIGTQYAENTYYLKSMDSRRNIKITIKLEDGDETFKLQIPFVRNNGTHVSTEMENNKNHPHGSPDIKNEPTIPKVDKHSSTNINEVLEKARTKIKDELSNYNFSQTGVDVLEDLVMESGGQPLRTLIISSWRSGSTFLGDLMNTVPSTYYHYEPLLMYGTKQLREPAEASKALSIVKRMFKCNFYDLEEYFAFESKDLHQFNNSTRLFDYCTDESTKELCYSAEFTSRLCKLFPFQSMKLVRLRLRLVMEILDDKELNVKVILLVRDPRGLMQSRRHRHFCELSSDCWEPSLVCADMISDYVAARQILLQYPDRLLVIRFEELAMEPKITADRILKFIKLDGRQAFDEFLQTHTTVEVAGVHSTVKVSRNIPFKWKNALDFNYVNKLQMSCKEAMNLWGYKMAHNETHMTSKDFYPIEDFTIS